MKLSALLSNILLLPSSDFLAPILNTDITSLCSDSREAQPGCVFFAYPGKHVDGRQYIDKVLQIGPSVVLYEADETWQQKLASYPQCIPVTDLEEKIGFIAARFYDYPSDAMDVIAVTGTNGKSSVTHYLAQAYSLLNEKAGVIGTIGWGVLGETWQPSTHTTPFPVTLQAQLAAMHAQGAKHVAIEASSHALDQARLNGVTCRVAAITNITRDHLDYHHTMEAYAAAKQKILALHGVEFVVYNADDPLCVDLVKPAINKIPCCGFSLQMQASAQQQDEIFPLELHYQGHVLHARVNTPKGELAFTTTLIGLFNLANLLIVIAVLIFRGVPLATIANIIPQIKPIKGRMEYFGGENKPLAVVDYAHTPDALENALKALRPICRGKLYCVFGCGGDRDAGKRPLMGAVAAHYADYVVLTSDNSRSESTQKIMQDIKQGITSAVLLFEEEDRAIAIHRVLQHAQIGDVVLLAGKGHEEYQILNGVSSVFSDIEEVKNIIGGKNDRI